MQETDNKVEETDSEKVLKKAIKTQAYYKQTFATPEGKEVLKDLLNSCGVLTTSFVPGDPYHTAYNEGRREIANRILAMVEADPEIYQKLFSEIEDEREVLDA